MVLHYLIFDACDDGEGQGSWEAMASVESARLPAVLAEVDAVLDWARRHAPGPRGPTEEGGLWDAQVDRLREGDRTTITLTLTGPWAWGEALCLRFAPEA